jgi:hypothetical protein
MFYRNFKYILFLILGEEMGICVLFTAKGNITIAEWSAHAPTAHVVVRSCLTNHNANIAPIDMWHSPHQAAPALGWLQTKDFYTPSKVIIAVALKRAVLWNVMTSSPV